MKTVLFYATMPIWGPLKVVSLVLYAVAMGVEWVANTLHDRFVR